ncbi:MAG TPA: class I adenylate-forming enzyme family protein [Acidimicrobiales bacterium]
MRTLVHDYLATAAREAGDRVALRDGDTTLTFADVDAASDSLAATLQHCGVERGDRVAIFAENSAELVVAVWGALKAGGVFVVINPTTKADKLTYLLTDCGAKALVAEARRARVLAPAVRAAPTVRAAVWIGDAPPPDVDGRDGGPLQHVRYEDAVRNPALPSDPGLLDVDLAGLVYTSGSTGRPKGVMLTHRNVAHNAWSISTYLGLRDDDLIACFLPLSFDYGLFQVFMGARVGCGLLLERSFAYPRDVLGRLADARATVLPGVPTVFAGLLALAPFDGIDVSSIRMLTNTAATLPPSHIERLREAFPQATIFSMYGLTECTRVSYVPPERLAEKPTSVGLPMPNTEAYVVDEEGRRVGPHVVGELVVRGASVMRGYWGKPEETAACLRPGEIEGELVLHTGDRFWADEEGYLYFVGREDDVFKCRGEKIAPKEIEQVLYELPDVAEAAVVGVPHELDGMAVKAVVVPAPGRELTEAQVRNHCRARLESHMVPRFVEVRDGLPKTDTGKIRRASLAALVGIAALPELAQRVGFVELSELALVAGAV